MDLEIINIASNTDNNRNIKACTHRSKLKNPFYIPNPCDQSFEILENYKQN